jgi:hypothetical protein
MVPPPNKPLEYVGEYLRNAHAGSNDGSRCVDISKQTTGFEIAAPQPMADLKVYFPRANKKPRTISEEQRQLTTMLEILCETDLIHIAKCMAPKDVYSLCLTSSYFHNSSSNSEKLIASELLHASLHQSLARVLSQKGVSLSSVSFPGQDVVLSGSTMFEAVLGEQSDAPSRSDIDLFCTAAAAPAVRSQLVKTAGMVLVGKCNTYGGGGNGNEHLDSIVHHVEGYAPEPDDPEWDRAKFIVFGKQLHSKNCYYSDDFLESMQSAGEPVPPNLFGKSHEIRCLGNEELPFDWDQVRLVRALHRMW